VKKQKEGVFCRKKLWYWGPVVIWMAVIFAGSSHPNVDIVADKTQDDPNVNIVVKKIRDELAKSHFMIEKNYIIKKLAHMAEYVLLGFLLFRALVKEKKNNLASRYAWLWALMGTILYGVSDEVHQMFVPTRTAYVGDIFINALGASIGQLFGIVVYTSFPGRFFHREV
jgi:VanZ family protein